MAKSDTWKLTDARKQFSEVVNRALVGEPQRITSYGKDVLVVIDRSRFEVVPKPLVESPKRPGGRTNKKRR